MKDEVAIENETETQTESSMEDTLRDGFRKFRSENPEPEVEAKPDAAIGKEPAAEATPVEDKHRAPDGKFVKVEKPETEAKPETPKRRPPTTWRKEALAKWETLDPLVQEEIEKRENDAMNGITQYKSRGEAAELWDRTLAPYQATLQSLGVAPQKAAQMLFASDHALRYGSPQQKVAMLHKLAKDYGVALEGLPEPEQQDPRIVELQERLSNAEKREQQREQERKQQEFKVAKGQLDELGKNAPYLDAVREEMAALLETGRASSLQDAYDKAVWSKAELRESLIAEMQKGKTQETARVANEARKASAVNIPTTGKVAAGVKQGSVEDDLKAGVRRLGLFQ